MHGADPSAYDINEKTAAKVAMENGHTDICYRLIELMYELTDRLTFYLCGRRPDHKNGINYLIPALHDRYVNHQCTQVTLLVSMLLLKDAYLDSDL